MTSEQQNPVVVTSTKSVGTALLLTFLFGPLGMFYVTIPGAIVMIILSGVGGALTMGVALIATWPIQMIWSVIAAKSYNKQLMAGARTA